MISKFISLLLISVTFFNIARAEFTENAYRCFDDSGSEIFRIGEYVQRDHYGRELRRYQRTDFSIHFANNLKERGLFGFRANGPRYNDHQNNLYSNNHRTQVIGNGHRGEFLFVFKPENNTVLLEIWKWSARPHYGHVVLPGDVLALKETFMCEDIY